MTMYMIYMRSLRSEDVCGFCAGARCRRGASGQHALCAVSKCDDICAHCAVSADVTYVERYVGAAAVEEWREGWMWNGNRLEDYGYVTVYRCGAGTSDCDFV